MIRVFIVEDESVIALELQDHLSTFGYEVCGHARSGKAALEQIPEARPDVILMDIKLGRGISGLDVAERLRGVVGAPVIFLTAYADRPLIKRAASSGSFSFLIKPFEPRLLQANIELALARHDALVALTQSEARFRRVVDHITDALLIDDVEGRVVFANDRFLTLFGIAREALLDVRLEDYVAPASRAELRERHNRRIAGDEVPGHFEYQGLRHDGSVLWVETDVLAVRDETGRITGTQSVLRDVTGRKRTQDSLARAAASVSESEQRYRRLFDESIECMYEADADGVFLRVNRAFADLVGFESPDGLVGTNTESLYAYPAERSRIRQAYSSGDKYERVPASWRRKNGELVSVELFGRISRGAHGEIAGYNGIVRDVTEQRLYDKTMRELSTGLSHLSGRAFFEQMAMRIAETVGAEIGFVSTVRRDHTLEIGTIGIAVNGSIVPGISCPLAGTPAEEVIAGKTVVIASGVQRLFPGDPSLPSLLANGYAAAPFLDGSGQVMGHVGVITRAPMLHPKRVETVVSLFALRAGAEIERQRADERFAGVFNYMPDALLIVDLAGGILAANRLAETTFGYTLAELTSLTVEHLVPAPERGNHAKLRAGFHMKARPRVMGSSRSRLWALRKDGVHVPVEISLSPFRTGEGDLVVAAVRDVTDRVRLEEEQERLTDRLRHAEKMDSLGTLAGGIAHDFNNLLGVIVGSTELAIARTAPTNPVAENLARIATASARATHLVEQILSFSRRQPLKPVVVSVGAVVDEVAALLRVNVPGGIAVVAKAGGRSLNTLGDSTQIHQVLMNLGTNAWHAIAPGPGTITFRVDTVASVAEGLPANLQAGQYVRIRVSDDGKGMDPVIMDRVFEPFFTTKGVGKGTGLGLAVAHGIVADHGGEISVASAPAGGSTFSVFLPVTLRDVDAAEEQGVLASTRMSFRVLLVDDDEMVLSVTADLLKTLGHSVLAISEPVAAFEAVRADPQRFDLVITDLSMPELNGIALSRAIAEVRPDLPIVLISGYRTYAEIELREAGILGFVPKPVSIASLGAVIDAAMRGKHPTG